jgi:hypothetical protein
VTTFIAIAIFSYIFSPDANNLSQHPGGGDNIWWEDLASCPCFDI